MTEADRLRAALRDIHDEFRFFRSCAGHVSREDMVDAIAAANKRIQEIREVVWPEGEEGEQS